MASVASDLDPAADPHAVGEPSSAGKGPEEESASASAKEVEVVVEEAAAGQEGEEEEEDEEGECGFCLFMKGGGCKEAFVAWEDCVQSAEKEGSDLVERCFQATANLKKCMDAHSDYYSPVLQAEEAVSEQAEAAIADANKSNGEYSAPSQDTDEKKEDAGESTATTVADGKDSTSSPAAGEKKEEAVVEKVGFLSLSN